MKGGKWGEKRRKKEKKRKKKKKKKKEREKVFNTRSLTQTREYP